MTPAARQRGTRGSSAEHRVGQNDQTGGNVAQSQLPEAEAIDVLSTAPRGPGGFWVGGF